MTEEPKEHHIGKEGLLAEDSFYTFPISFLEGEMFWYIINALTFEEYSEEFERAFRRFLDGCYEKFTQITKDKGDTYHYFNNIHTEFKLLKQKLFKEKECKISHSITEQIISDQGNKIQQITNLHYIYIIQIIETLATYRNKKLSPDTPPPLNIKHGFKVYNYKCIADSFNQMKRKQIIQIDTKLHDFQRIFSGYIIQNKITWLWGPGYLSYFIKEINGKGVEDEKKNIWRTTVNCFKDKTGSNFEVKQLRHSKSPKRTENLKVLDIIISTINEDTLAKD